MLSVVILIILAGRWFPALWFETLTGAALLLVFITDLRHIENLSMVWFLESAPEGFKGKIEQSYKLSQRRVAVGVFNTGLLYLAVFLLTQRLFFIGGGVICMLYALRHYLLSNRQLTNPTSVS